MPKKKKEAGPEIGEVIDGFNSLVLDGRAFDYYNPDALLIKKGNEVYRRMMNDEQVKAVLAFKKAAVIARGFNFESDADSPEQIRIAEFFTHVIDSMRGSFSDRLKYILSGLQNGFSICEKVYRSTEWEGRTYWATDLKLKPWDTFVFEVDPYGNIKAVKQETSFLSQRVVKQSKVVHWVYQPDIDPIYGESDLRAAYRAWWSKDIAIKFQCIHLERHGSGFPIVTAQDGASQDNTIKNKLISILKNISVRTGIFLPRNYKFEMVHPEKTDAYEKAIAQHDKSIAKSMLVPNLLGLSEQGNTGSYSQSKTQFDVFLWIIEDICNTIAECLNEQFFADLALWNFGTADFPKFQFDPMTEDQKIAMAKTWTELLKGGAVTNSDRDEAFTRALLGYPEKEEEPEEDPVEDPVEDPEVEDPEVEDPEIPINEHTFVASMSGPWLRRVNFKAIEQTMDNTESALVDQLLPILGKIRLSVESQIAKIAGDRSFGNIELKEFGDLKIPKNLSTKLKKAIQTNLASSFNASFNQAAKELPKKLHAQQIVGMDKTRAERFLKSKAFKIAGIIDEDTLRQVLLILENGIKYDKSLKDIMQAMATETKLVELLPEVDAAGRAINTPARIETIARTNISDAVNQGRMSLFGRPEFKGFVLAYEYSAILDERTSDICERLNGKIRRDWGELTPINHHSCRSLLVPVTAIDDWDGEESSIPSSIKPAKGFK